jgi:hypothetical protein
LYSLNESEAGLTEFWIGFVDDFVVVVVAVEELSEIEAEASDVVWFVLFGSFLDFVGESCKA